MADPDDDAPPAPAPDPPAPAPPPAPARRPNRLTPAEEKIATAAGVRWPVGSDTLDAMTSDRPYRCALPFAAAREEIVRESERQFDPEVVKGFLAIPQEVLERIRLEAARHHTRSGLTGQIGPREDKANVSSLAS